MKGRSSCRQSISVLRAIGDGLTPSEIKLREGLSRYSHQFVVNRLINTELVDYQGNCLGLVKKELNIMSFDGEKEWIKIEKVAQIASR